MRAERLTGRKSCSGALERDLRGCGYHAIAGVDEVGRGALFGAVFAAAVVLSPDRPIRGLQDSKQLEPARRDVLARRIRERAVAWSIAAVDAATIDRINIYEASRVAMRLAVERLAPSADYLLIDAVYIDVPLPQRAFIKGDARCQSIAAASILAKVERDACMTAWDEVYPQYSFARSKGYGTPEHMRALRELGPTPLHRLSFAPVRENALFPWVRDAQPSLFDDAFEATPLEAGACP